MDTHPAQVWAAHPGRADDGALLLDTPTGQVRIGHIAEGPAGEALVWTGAHRGRPQLRLINPPTGPGSVEAIAVQTASVREAGR
jgi:hypothetical protein